MSHPLHPPAAVIEKAAAAHAASICREPLPDLPADFDTALFDADQLEYLSDYYHDARRAALQAMFDLLVTGQGGRTATPTQAGLNIFIFGKLAGLSKTLLELGWKDLARALYTNNTKFFAQKKAFLQRLRLLHPKKCVPTNR